MRSGAALGRSSIGWVRVSACAFCLVTWHCGRALDRLRPGVVSASTASTSYRPVGEPGKSTDLGGCVNMLNSSKSITKKSHGIKPNTTLIQVEKWTGVDTWKPAEAANGQ